MLSLSPISSRIASLSFGSRFVAHTRKHSPFNSNKRLTSVFSPCTKFMAGSQFLRGCKRGRGPTILDLSSTFRGLRNSLAPGGLGRFVPKPDQIGGLNSATKASESDSRPGCYPNSKLVTPKTRSSRNGRIAPVYIRAVSNDGASPS